MGKKSQADNRTKRQNGKLGHTRILRVSQIKPSPENIDLYGPVDPEAKETIELRDSIQTVGFNSVLVVSEDFYILSGHRRQVAAPLAGLEELPCIVEPIRRLDDTGRVNPQFVQRLEMYNRQREKTLAQKMREAVVKSDPVDAHRALSRYRQEQARLIDADVIELREFKRRARISRAKSPFMLAIQRILEGLREYWPVSDRLIHYQLLNDPPLKHASKPESHYQNDKESYKSLTELLTRMRLYGHIAMNCIADETRPTSILTCYQDAAGFLDKEVNGFLKGYYRDLMQSQPNHIEIVYEKLTGRSFIEPTALDFCIPLTIGRGFSSLPPRAAMAARYRKSDKEKLIIISMSDLDPDGDEITHSFARSMRDDFNIEVECIKAALTMEQVQSLELPPNRLKAKKKSTNYAKYRSKYGTDDVYELEALRPERQRELLEAAILDVIDIDKYNYEVSQEREEASFLDVRRQEVRVTLGG